MSTFRNHMTITLDGEPYKVTTRAVDFTTAEVQVAKDGGTVMEQPMALRFRLAWVAFRRTYPDEDLARSGFGMFMEKLDDIDEEGDAAGVDALDPTPPADSDD